MPSLKDFFIGVIDLIAVLLPGAVLAYFVVKTTAPAEGWRWDLTGNEGALAFLVASYLGGHLIFMFGSALDPVYDWRRKRKMPVDKDRAFAAATALRQTINPELNVPSISTFKWAKAYVALHAPAGRAEIDSIEATSKLFRGLVVMFLGAAIASGIHPILHVVGGRMTLTAVSLVLAWLCFLRYYDQRWKLTELAYTYAVLVHTRSRTPRASAAAAKDE